MTRQGVELDPAILAVLDDGDARATRKSKRAPRRPRQGQRRQKNFRLNPQIGRMIDLVAEVEGTSPAGVVDLFVARAVELYLTGEVDFNGSTVESRSPGQDWVVQVPGLNELEQRLVEFINEDGRG